MKKDKKENKKEVPLALTDKENSNNKDVAKDDHNENDDEMNFGFAKEDFNQNDDKIGFGMQFWDRGKYQIYLGDDVVVIKQKVPNLYDIYIFDKPDNDIPLLADVYSENLAVELSKIMEKSNDVPNADLWISSRIECVEAFDYLCNERITKVRIPDTCSIREGAFMGCPNLEEVIYYETGSARNISIGSHAFFGCNKLKRVLLPPEMGSIKENAFGSCPEIKDIIVESPNPPEIAYDKDFERSAFGNIDLSHCTLHVPSFALSNYVDREFWGDFGAFTKIKNLSFDVKPYMHHKGDEGPEPSDKSEK
jgi:hypothetical protein